MTDTAKVIRLEPEVQRHIRARLARLPAGVHSYLESGKKLLAESLISFFDSADDALFELADRADSNHEQNLYFDSMREVRVQRKGVETRFLDTIDEAFARLVGQDDRDELKGEGELSADALSLVQNEDLEQLVAVEATISRVAKSYLQHTAFAVQRLTPFVPLPVNEKNYPFGPQVLCAAMMSQIKRLDVDIKAKLALFELFEQTVLLNISDVYTQLSEVLAGSAFESKGVNSTRSSVPVDSSKATVPNRTSLVDDRGENQPRDGAEKEKIRPALMEMLNFVQKLPVKGGTETGIDILKVINSVQQHRDQQLSLSRIEHETINLVQKMFRFILKDYDLALPCRELVCRLQVPVLKTALIEPQFLQDKRHPARRFLNEFVATAFQWNAAAQVDESDSLFNKMESIVAQIATHKLAYGDLYKTALADFSSYLDNEKKRSAVLEKRTIDAEDGKARAEEARKTVANEVRTRTLAYTLPSVVHALIDGPWSNVIFVTGLKYGKGSPEWQEQLNVLSDLVWSVQPSANKGDRQKLIRLIPDLLNRLRRGLDSISYNPFEVSELFSGLEEIHLSRIRGEVLTEDRADAGIQTQTVAAEGDVDGTSMEMPETPEASEVTETGEDSARQEDVENNGNETSNEGAQEAALSENDADMRAVAMFTQGAWFDLNFGQEDVLRCRLAAFIKPTGKYIFVNRSGSKVAEKTQTELALMMKQNALRAVDNSMLFDKALESVVTGLRKSRSDMPLDTK